MDKRFCANHDDSSRVTQIDAEVGLNAFQKRVGYGYNGFSELRHLVRLMNGADKSTSYVYDQFSRLIESHDFLDRTTKVKLAPYCVSSTVTTPRGVQRATSFNTLCQLVQLDGGDERQNFLYDELGRLLQAQTGAVYKHLVDGDDKGGHYNSAPTSLHTTRYRYDALDRVTHISYAAGEVSYSYDFEGNVTTMTDTNGRVTSYGYFPDGRLQSVIFGRSGQPDLITTYDYDAAGRLSKITYPSTTGMVASFTKPDGSTGWDPSGQLLCLRYLKGGAHFHRFEYAYDDAGNRTQMVDTPANPGQAVTWSYGYDWLNRLTSVSRNGVQTSLYAYDESDNRITLTLPQANQVYSYAYTLADEIVSRSLSTGGALATVDETYTHDADGNMIARVRNGVTTNYDWNYLNKLNQRRQDDQVQERHAYDTGGIRRLKKDADNTRYFSSGSMSLSEVRPSGPVSYVQGHQLIGFEQGGSVSWLITDGLSSVRAIVDSNGNAIGEFRYDEFGQQESVTAPTESRALSYVGGLGVRNDWDSSGLFYMQQRYYDPILGRFLSQDPIGFAGGFNKYVYTNQNPTSRVDPTGLDWSEALFNFLQWVGGGQVTPHYGPGSQEVIDLAASPGIQRLRNYYARKNAGAKAKNCPEEAVTEFDANFGLSEFMEATISLNATRHYVGTFNAEMFPTGNGRVHITVCDSKSRRSFFYHAPGVTNVPYLPGTWMGDQYQTYEWDEVSPTVYNPAAPTGFAGQQEDPVSNYILNALNLPSTSRY